MTEVQAHGKTWEKEIAMNVFKATEHELKQVHYTATHDIPAAINHLEPDTSISVKVSCSENSIGMGDALRVFDTVSSGHKIHAVVLLYKQDCAALTKTMTRILEVDLTGSVRELFGSITRKDLQDLNELIHAVPQALRKRIVVDGKKIPQESVQRSAYLAKQVELLEKTGAIFLNPKVDETNSRLQCSFNKFQKFLTDYPERLKAQTSTENFRGGTITKVIDSSPRKFTKKENIGENQWASASVEPGALEGMTVSQLGKGATIAGLKKSGKKADIIERLRKYYVAQCKPCEDDASHRGGRRNTRRKPRK